MTHSYPSLRSSDIACTGTLSAQEQHRRQESLLRLGSLSRIQGHHARGQFRTDRNPPRTAIGQEFRRHPAGGQCAGPLLYQAARRYFRDNQRRFRFFATGFQTARERQARSEEHTSELQSLMRISYAVLSLKKTRNKYTDIN